MSQPTSLQDRQALEGIKVVEFAAFAAGPAVGKFLADHGAEVIRVESHARPDGFRTHYPPFKDNVPGLNRSGLFALCNNNKLSVTLNLKLPGALELALGLVARADIVIENFTPGTMKRLGLGYEELQGAQPQLIMLSTCNQGQTGPHAHHPGFGSHLSSLSGFTHLTGYADGPPLLFYGPYIDYIAVGYGLVAILAALDYRRRTGQGQYIDLSQYEAGLQFIAPALLDRAANGRNVNRRGNLCPFPCPYCPQACPYYAAPYGVYPCQSASGGGEDAWCTISVFSEEEWQALCTAMGDPPWSQDPRFATREGRKRHQEELDRLLAQWTSQYQPHQVMELLQGAGVPAAAVHHVKDLFTDPQLAQRGVWRELEHPEIGRHHYEAPPFLLSETPAELHSPAPCLGEDNRYVFTQLLGLSEEEFQDLVARGVID